MGAGQRLVEPFAGSAAVFLNTDYTSYLLADSNRDLINLYQQLKTEGETFIRYCRVFFTAKNNSGNAYYELRSLFNKAEDVGLKSALFVYLNRHCYNGLCRYNASGEFNSPFGRYTKPYFPEKEMLYFQHKAGQAEFLHAKFQETLRRVQRGDIVYCDPPYAPLSKTACFTDYAAGGFSWENQMELAEWAGRLAHKGIQVVISNHNIKAIKELYEEAGAATKRFMVRRMISCQVNNRARVGELLAIFQPA